jgi:hydroxymethylpyrimidine pyrophosphatase-like HAD family hydrolase
MTTLYLSDLDGTLLGPDQRLSPRTTDVVTRFVHSGARFSYATARSLVTAEKVTEGLPLDLPAIVYNGVFIVRSAPRRVLHFSGFSGADALYLRETLTELGVRPIVYALIDGIEKFSFATVGASAGMTSFLDSRLGDARRRPVDDLSALYDGDVFYVTCIGDGSELEPVRDRFMADPRFTTIYQRDIYSGAPWCELMPAAASKAAAALRLKDLLGCDRLVSFGDGANDLALFAVSDECYAVENAVPELRAVATSVIGGNDDDGVARWLESRLAEVR